MSDFITIPAMFAPYIMDALAAAVAHDTDKMRKADRAGEDYAVDYYEGQLTYYREAFEAIRAAHAAR